MSSNVNFKNARGVLEPARRRWGFTLVELLSVLAVIAIIAGLVLVSIPSIKGSRDITQSAYVLAGALEQARSYALANTTYAWVGFFEENGSQNSTNPATTGIGRLVISLVASQDGTRYSDNIISTSAPNAFGAASPTSNTVVLTQISPLIKLSNVHMVAANAGTGLPTANNPVRPVVASAYQVGDSGLTVNNLTGAFTQNQIFGGTNPTTFAYPLQTAGAPTAQYTFVKIIEFNPQGEASKIVENVFSGPGPQNKIEIALQPTHGNAVAPPYSGTTTAAAAIQVEGLSGQVRVYRP